MRAWLLLFYSFFSHRSFNCITHAGARALTNSLWGYTGLVELHLDNNGISDRGAQHIAAVFPTTQIDLLNVGFNSIGSAGMVSLMQQVATNKSLRTLILSGNRLELEGGHAVATALGRNSCLKQVFLDHTELSQLGQCHVTTELVNNQHLALNKITGFNLGLVVAQLRMPGLQQHASAAHEYATGSEQGSPDTRKCAMTAVPPATIEACSNEIVLQYIRLMWQQPLQVLSVHERHRQKAPPHPIDRGEASDHLSVLKATETATCNGVMRDVVRHRESSSDSGFAAAAAAAAASVMLSTNSLGRLEHGMQSDGFLDRLVSDKCGCAGSVPRRRSVECKHYGNTRTLPPSVWHGLPGAEDAQDSQMTRDMTEEEANCKRVERSDAHLLSELSVIAKMEFDSAELWELHQCVNPLAPAPALLLFSPLSLKMQHS